MAVSKELVEAILSFHTDQDGVRQPLDLGSIDQTKRLVYGAFPYQRRAVYIPGEPLVMDWTTQPVLGIEAEGRVATLAYVTDVIALGDLAAQVADRLNAIKQRPE